MAINQFPAPVAAQAGLSKFAMATNADGRVVIEEIFSPGIYSFTGPSTTYNVAWYDATNVFVGGGNATVDTTSFAVNLTTVATKLVFTSTSANAPITVDITPLGAARSIVSQFVTTTGSVTITQTARVFVLGGGAGGGNGGGGGSGYLTIGTLAPGTYTATIGAAGAANADGSSSSIDALSALGGSRGSGVTGGAGGSGGGGGSPSGSFVGALGGINGSNGNNGASGSVGGIGSLVACQGFVSGAQGGDVVRGKGGGTYGGGNGAISNSTGGIIAASGRGGGGGGGGNSGSGGSGTAGAILILENY